MSPGGRATILAVTMAVVVAACGGGDGDAVASLSGAESTAAGPSIDVDAEQQLLAFASCMRDQGVDLPDPTVDIDGNVLLAPPPDFEIGDLDGLLEAAEQCEEFLEGVSLGFEDVDLTAISDTLLSFAGCMRENGYELQDPDLSFLQPGAGSVPVAGPFGEVDLGDPDFLDALDACQDILADLGVPGS